MTSRTPDHELFKNLALTYANHHNLMGNGINQCNGNFPNFPITNGADWYHTNGMKSLEGCKILTTCLAIVWNSLWNFRVASFQWLQNCQKNGTITSNILVLPQ